MTYIYATFAILAGAAIGLACRVKADRQLWQQRLRDFRLSKSRMDHRKYFFRAPRDSGSAIQPFVEFLGVLVIALFFVAVLAGFCH